MKKQFLVSFLLFFFTSCSSNGKPPQTEPLPPILTEPAPPEEVTTGPEIPTETIPHEMKEYITLLIYTSESTWTKDQQLTHVCKLMYTYYTPDELVPTYQYKIHLITPPDTDREIASGEVSKQDCDQHAKKE